MSITAAIYVRISRDKTGQKAGTGRQADDCKELASKLGWTVAKVYEDNDISAYSGRERPQYEAMLADIKAGKVSAVLAWHHDRLHRSMKELERFIDIVNDHKVEVRTVQGGLFDLATSSGRMFARIVGSVARQESEHRGERVSRARQQNAREGRWNGGRRCYGYEADGMTVREPEASEVRGMADAVITGSSLRTIVRDLNSRRVPTANGGTWTGSSVRDLLLSPRIAGLSSYKGSIVGEALWPPLVPEDLWRGVTAVLSDPSRRTNYVGASVKWLGSGLYRCGVCGSANVRVGSVEGRKRYRCCNRTPDGPRVHVGRDAVLLDAYVESLIIARLSQPDFLTQLPQPTDGLDVVALQKDRAVLGHRLEQLSTALADLQIEMPQFITATRKLEDRIAALDSEITMSARETALGDFYLGEDVHILWHQMGIEQKRAILSQIMTVTINRTKPGRAKDGSYFRTEDIQIDWTDYSNIQP